MDEPHAHRPPSEIDRHRSWFDELAAWAEEFVSRDVFFVAIVILTAIWAPSYFIFDSLSHWHLAYVLPAEILTLFVVALLANHDRRSEQALHRKTDAIASALAALVEVSGATEACELAKELRAAHGLEDRESTDGS